LSSVPSFGRLSPARQRLILLIGALVVVGVAVNAVLIIRSAPFDVRPFQPDTKVIFERDSPYHHIIVSDVPPAFRHLQFGTMTTQSQMDLRDPNGPGFEYVNYMLIPKLLNPGARRILFIGLGGGTAAKLYVRLFPDVTIDAVEIDPLVIDVAQKLFFVKPSSRLRLHNGDGRLFVKRTTETFDIVIIDAYTVNRYGSTIPANLVTKEFFAEIAGRLSSDGILYFHCTSLPDRPLPLALQKTFREVFPVLHVFADGGFTEFIAARSTKTSDLEELRRRAAALPIPRMTDRINRRIARLPSTAGSPVLTDDYAPVDQLLLGQTATK